MTAAEKLSFSHTLHPSVLREYDIRGIVGETLDTEDAYAIGRGFGSLLYHSLGRPASVTVGRDGRLSSPALHRALVQGLTDSGTAVYDIGVGPTPMLYFAAQHLRSDGGIMITGSHNPPQHNGFKIVRDGASFFGEDIRLLGQHIAEGALHHGIGSTHLTDVRRDYLNALLTGMQPEIASVKNLCIAWDPGNGAAGEMVDALCPHLAAQHHAINTTIDGTFPSHHPDPSVPQNLTELAALVHMHRCDIGLAFDGDGDRLGVIDDQGRMVSPDHLLMLLARDVLAHCKGTIIADVKTSQTFFDDVAAHGGTPLMYKTGHSHIKSHMKTLASPFAGEASGHIFFADRYFGFDDGLYAAVRLINWLRQQHEPLSTLVDALPHALSTPEIRLHCADDRKFVVVAEVAARLHAQHTTFCDIDGVRAQTPDGWWLVRASNTQAVINARCESTSAEGLARLTDALRTQLAASGITLNLEGDNHAAH